jgi:omega-6 fatty acid desaturase (delta-12 desaturase)
MFSNVVRQRSDFKGVLYPSIDYSLYLLSLLAILYFDSYWIKGLLSFFVVPILLSRLFVLGHDLAHRSLAESKAINVTFGRLVFIPTWHSFSLWQLLHNVYHHGFTNIRKADYSWAPLSPAEFRSLSRPRRLLYRIERTVYGHGVWVLIEHLLLKMLIPRERDIGKRKKVYTLDSLLVISVNILQVTLLTFTSRWMAQSGLANRMDLVPVLFFTLVVPVIVFSWLYGWIVFIQHTAPEIPWYTTESSLGFLDHQKSVTPEWLFPPWFGWLFHFIHVHTVHHVDPRIPAYNLTLAQKELLQESPERVTTIPFTLHRYFDTMKRCKLYDFGRQRWCDYEGVPTGPVLNFCEPRTNGGPGGVERRLRVGFVDKRLG